MYGMLEKTARKPSADPVQEKLRQNKALWNKDVSAFVNDLIHLKKMMNGWPSKFFKERSRIVDPVPADPATIIGSLASDFQEIAQRGNALVAEQLAYSKNRKKKQPKAPQAPGTPPTPATPEAPAAPAAPATPTPPAQDLSKQLAAFEQKYSLVAEGSNPITRFFARLLNPTIGIGEAARIRRYRMSLLNACVKSYKDLGKLQVEIVKSSKESITSSNKLLHQAWNDWILVAKGFSTYKLNMPKVVEDTGGDIETPKDMVEEKEKEKVEKQSPEEFGKYDQTIDNYEHKDKFPLEETPSAAPASIQAPNYNANESMVIAKAIMQDYKRVLAGDRFPGETAFAELNNLIGKYTMAPVAGKAQWAAALVQEYRNVLVVLNQRFGTSGATLAQIADARDAKNQSVPPKTATQMEVVAQAFLQKWLGKTRHQLSLFDKTSSYRLDIYKMSDEVRKTLDQIMNSLEKDMNVDELDPMISEVNRKMTTLRGLMRALHYGQ